MTRGERTLANALTVAWGGLSGREHCVGPGGDKIGPGSREGPQNSDRWHAAAQSRLVGQTQSAFRLPVFGASAEATSKEKKPKRRTMWDALWRSRGAPPSNLLQNAEVSSFKRCHCSTGRGFPQIEVDRYNNEGLQLDIRQNPGWMYLAGCGSRNKIRRDAGA